MSANEVLDFVKSAVECSVFLAPTDTGLSYDEIVEAAKQAGYLQGEIGDAFVKISSSRRSNNRFVPDEGMMTFWNIFMFRETPDYRNLDAFDFVYAEMNTLIRSEGIARATIERSVLVERGVAKNIPRHDLEVAVAMLTMSGYILSQGDLLKAKSPTHYTQLPSAQRNSDPSRSTMPKPARAKAYPIVKDIIGRRTDGRSKHAEPLDAFAEALQKLNYGHFRLWWMQIVAELRQSNTGSSPVAVCVLAAALVEGALTFVVRHARALNLPVLASKTFNEPSRTWKIDDLVASAAAGGNKAILDHKLRVRADALILTRQRIHAGRMLVEYPQGVPDLRPDEARDAKMTAELVVRAVLDWLERNPPTPSAP